MAVPCWATDYASEANLPAVLDLAGQQKARGLWRRIQPDFERAFDVVEMTQLVRTAGCVQFLPIHAGVVVIPGTLMHVERITDSLLVDYRCDRMVRNRIVGFWRHRELDDAA